MAPCLPSHLFNLNIFDFLSHSTTEKHIRTVYGIRCISEITGLSSDVYCQSNNDNNIQISCALYVESIQVKHIGELGREQRKRERDIADWGERETT